MATRMICVTALALSVSLIGVAPASANIFKKIGKGISKTVKVVERKTVNTVKDVGRIASKDVKAVGKGVGGAGRAIGRGAVGVGKFGLRGVDTVAVGARKGYEKTYDKLNSNNYTGGIAVIGGAIPNKILYKTNANGSMTNRQFIPMPKR